LDHAPSQSVSRCGVQVAPGSASSGSTCNASPGHPVLRAHWLCRRPCFRVTPKHDPLTVAGDGFPRRLESRVLQRCWLQSPELPRTLALPAAPPDARCRLPRALHLPASPATDPRGESRFGCFGGAD